MAVEDVVFFSSFLDEKIFFFKEILKAFVCGHVWLAIYADICLNSIRSIADRRVCLSSLIIYLLQLMFLLPVFLSKRFVMLLSIVDEFRKHFACHVTSR